MSAVLMLTRCEPFDILNDEGAGLLFANEIRDDMA